MSRFFAFVLPLALATSSCSLLGPPLRSPADGGRRWIELSTSHFDLATDLPVAEGRAMLAELETSVQTLEDVAFPDEHQQPLRLRVVAFESVYDYRAVSPWGTSGYYFDAKPGYLENAPTIVTFGALTPETRAVAVHELVHAFVRRAYVWAPTWLDEGLAQYFSSLRVDGGFVLLGAPVPGDVVFPSLVPRARDIVAADRDQFDGRKGTSIDDSGEDLRRAGYYQGAWALVHMLRNGPDDYRARFDRFIEAANRGASLSGAWSQSQRDLDGDRFERDFRSYVERGEWSLVRTPIPEHSPPRVAAPRAMSDGEVKMLWAGLIGWQGEGIDQATKWLDDAVRQAPASPKAHYWRGLLALHAEHFATAITEEREALRLSPNAPDAMFALAASLWRSNRVRPLAHFALSSELETLADGLERAAQTGIEHAFVADVRLRQRRVDEALAASERAVSASPLSSRCLATRARVLFAAGREAEAVSMQERAIRYLPDGPVPPSFSKDLARYRAGAARGR